MAQEIHPEKQSVRVCLQQKTYYVDFYQREYVWTKDTVDILLRDIFYAFEISYNAFKDEEMCEETLEKYSWYYLNVFITNNVNGKVYIVDGQQRLTTLTLIATKLYHMTKDDRLKDTLKECIFTKDIFKGNVFCIDNEKRRDVMQCILNGTEYTEPYKNATEKNLIERFQDINKYIDDKQYDEVKLDTFVYYFLERLVLVELLIKKDDTPMVFEVINDRGEALKPFEILKGKMVGLLPKADTEDYSKKWDKALQALEDKQDDFFIDYIRSRFIFRSNAQIEQAISKFYHRYIFDNNSVADDLAFRRTDSKHIGNIKQFINADLSYYAKLYSKIRENNDIFLKYDNVVNGFSGQYQNIMAACSINDPQEEQKIKLIAKESDRVWVLLNLNGVYDSNAYQDLTYKLNEQLRGTPLSEYRAIFDNLIIETICKKRNLDGTSQIPLLDFPSFQKRNYSNLNTRFLRYFFSRIEAYICEKTHQTMQNDVIYVSTKTGNKMGYHIEHILAKNEESVGYFKDEEDFNEKRNLLGGLLLLKGLDNISAGNEIYKDKLKTYSNGFVWGHTLCEDFYHANKDFEAFNKLLLEKTGINFKPYSVFDKNALIERCELLFHLVKIIWEV